MCFSSCSNTDSEAEIWDTIIAEDSFFSDYSLDIDKKEITQRDTSTERGFDIVYAKLTASNKDFIYEAEYTLDYNLYDDGWRLDDFTHSYEVIPAYDCPESVSEAAVRKEYPNSPQISFLYSDKDDSYNHFEDHYYTVSKKISDMVTYIYEISVECRFLPEEGWYVYGISEGDREVEWELEGTRSYSYKDNDFNLQFEIKNLNFDFENKRAYADINYSFTSYVVNTHDWNDWWNNEIVMQTNKEYTSGGFITVELNYYDYQILSYKVGKECEIDIFGYDAEYKYYNMSGVRIQIYQTADNPLNYWLNG